MSGTPRRCSEMMMKRRRPQRPSLGAFQLGYEALELGRFESAALLTPRPDRVQPNDSEPTRDVDRLRRSEDTIPLFAGPGEARREDVRNIMVPRNGEEWQTEAFEQLADPFELRPATAVREVARDDEDLGIQPGKQRTQGREWLRLRATPEVEIRDVKNPSGHGRGTIATS